LQSSRYSWGDFLSILDPLPICQAFPYEVHDSDHALPETSSAPHIADPIQLITDAPVVTITDVPATPTPTSPPATAVPVMPLPTPTPTKPITDAPVVTITAVPVTPPPTPPPLQPITDAPVVTVIVTSPPTNPQGIMNAKSLRVNSLKLISANVQRGRTQLSSF
jgi:hypothetical protein